MGAGLRITVTLLGRGRGRLGGENISLNCYKWLQINRTFLQVVGDAARDLPRRLAGVAEIGRLTGQTSCGHVVSGMSVTIQLDLPEALVKEAKANGLLESRRLGEMLNEELRRERARKDLGRVLKELHSLPGEPMPPEEIQAEIDAVRSLRATRTF
jgi:hypothetical protein